MGGKVGDTFIGNTKQICIRFDIDLVVGLETGTEVRIISMRNGISS